jgi:hypothetical protein
MPPSENVINVEMDNQDTEINKDYHCVYDMVTEGDVFIVLG